MTEETPRATTAVLVTRDGMGTADTALAHKLAQTWLGLLDVDDLDGPLPECICFYAEGVRLVVEGSPVLEELQALADHGVDLVACGTCLNFYGLADSLRVGRQGTMRDIVSTQWRCDKVITL